MVLAGLFLGSLSIFVSAILLASRPARDEQRMLARFAGLGVKGTHGLMSAVEAEGSFFKTSGAKQSSRFDGALTSLSFIRKVVPLLKQADSTMTLKKLLLTCVGTGVSGMVVTLILLPVPGIAVLAGAGTSYLPVLVLLLRRRRRMAAFDQALPDAIDMMSRSLRAGHSLVASISIVAEQAPEPARTEFSEVFRKQNFGLPLRDALLQMLERVPSPDLRVLVTGILVQKDTGGNLVAILDRIVAVIRERLKIQGEIRIHTAQGRMTGWILCLLPIVMLVTINMINPGYSKALTGDPLGLKLLYGGCVLLAIGAYLIKHIVDAIEV